MGALLHGGSRSEAAAVCLDCPVRRHSLCGTLADEALAALHGIGSRRRIARGETIVLAGDESRGCANLLSGIVKLSASTSEGREQVVDVLYPSDFIGRPYAEHHEFTATALSDAEICHFPRTGFESLLERHSALERELLRRTLAALDSARSQMLVLAQQSAEERVAGFLLRTAERIGGCSAMPGGPLTFDLPLSRGAMADVLGLTIETVSRRMAKLKADGVIALPGVRTVTIIRHDTLRRLAGA